jgi:hypothetical protein
MQTCATVLPRGVRHSPVFCRPPGRHSSVAFTAVALFLVLLCPGPAAAEGPTRPTAHSGSLAPDVFFDDITYTLRPAYFRTITVSPHDPKVAYAGSYNGFLWRTLDGGKTWEETRLIVEPPSFYGDLYQTVYFGVHRLPGGPSCAFEHFLSRRAGRAADVETAGGEGGAAGGGAGGAAANVNFGIGLPGTAPRLQLLVRKFGKPTSGMNIKQTLLLRGSRPTEIRMIVIHPSDPNVVFACTAFGLYKTYDGGLNWVRTFTGTSPAGRVAYHLALNPRDQREVLLGTGEGLYVSHDGGESFLKSTAKGVGEGTVNWIAFDPDDSRYVFVGTDSGVLRSPNGGSSWDYIYFTTFPTARIVRRVTQDPFDHRTGYIATHDGIFVTSDLLHGGLESWQRLGGLQFTGVKTSNIVACPRHRGHLWALTNMEVRSVNSPGDTETGGAFVWESIDAGQTWQVLFSGNTQGTMQWFDNSPQDPDLLWLAWSRSLLRMQRRASAEIREREIVVPDDPPIGEVIQAAFRYTGTDPGLALQYRQRSRLKALVPTLDASYRTYRWDDYRLLFDGLLPSLPFRQNEGAGLGYGEFRAMLTWDLGPLVFNLDSTLFGRVERLTFESRENVRNNMHRLYGERRRLRILLANEPPAGLRERIIYRLRIEELTAYIDFMTGNYLTRWAQGDRPSGRDTEWWTPWPVRAR